MDRRDTGSPPRLHGLGRVRTESSDDSREHLWAFWRRAKIRPRRPGFAVGFAALLALRTDVICGIFGSKRGAAIRYGCNGKRLDCGEGHCISFGGLRTEEAARPCPAYF